MEAIDEWTEDKPLPIYFNLANNIELVEVLKSLNNELNTNLTIKDLKDTKVQLFVDSFDEGLGIKEHRETLIEKYFE